MGVHLPGTHFPPSPPFSHDFLFLLSHHVSLRHVSCKQSLRAELGAHLLVPMALFFTLDPVALYHYCQWVCPTTQTVSSKKTRGYLLFIKSPTSTWLIVHNWDPIKCTEWINEKMDGWLNCKLWLTSIKAINQYSVTAKAIAATQGPPWELKIPKIAWPALGVSHQDKGGWDWEGETNQRQDHVLIRLSLLQGPIPQASSDKKKIIQHEVFVFKHSLDELKYWYFPDVFSLYFEQWFLFLVDKILVRINMARGRKISSSFTHIPLKSGETHSTLK